MKSFNPEQKLMLSAEHLFDINPLKKYQILFSNLNRTSRNHKGYKKFI